MVVPFITIYLTQHLHYSLVHATMVNAMFGLGAIAGALLGGRLTDKTGFVSVQLAALFGGGLLFILLGYIEHFYSICFVSFLLSMVNDAFRPANSAAIAAYSLPENRTRSYSLNRLAVNLGWAVGASLGGILAGINYHLLFWVDGLTNLAAAVILWIFFIRNKPVSTLVKKSSPHEKVASPWRDIIYLRFIAIVTIWASCFMLTFRILPVYFKEIMKLKEATIGLILGLNGIIIAMLEMVMVSKLEGKRHMLSYIRFGLFLGASSFLTLLIPGPAIIIALLCIVLVTVSEIFAMPFMNTFWINRSGENNRGRYAALYTIAWSIAQIAGPYIGALIVDNSSYTVLWIIASAVTMGGAIFINSLKEKPVVIQEAI